MPKAELDELDESIRESQDAVSGVEDEVFATFCQRLGFDDIRDYEARQGSMQQEAVQKKLEFTTQKSRIENQLSFEKQRLEATEDRIKSLQRQEQRDRALVEELNEQREEIQTRLDVLNAELDQLGEALEEQKELHQKSGDRLAEQRKEVLKRSKNVETSSVALLKAKFSAIRPTDILFSVAASWMTLQYPWPLDQPPGPPPNGRTCPRG